MDKTRSFSSRSRTASGGGGRRSPSSSARRGSPSPPLSRDPALPADASASSAPDALLGLLDQPWYEALAAHIDTLGVRAARERAARESKWTRNELTSEGLPAEPSGDAAESAPGMAADEQWRTGDGGDTPQARLRVARQKVVAARSAIGDAVYRGNRVPFLLGLRGAAAAALDEGSRSAADEELQRLKRRVEGDLMEVGAAEVMRQAIETGAAYGEYWLHGGMAPGPDGRARALVETPSPWEMFFDDGGAGVSDLERCEYVMRRRWLSRFELGALARAAGDVIDRTALESVMPTEWGGRPGSGGAGRAGVSARGAADSPRSRERRDADVMEVREFWAFVPLGIFEDPDRRRSGDMDQALSWDAVMVLTVDGVIVGVVRDPGPRPYWRGEWDRDPVRALPQGVLDALEGTQAALTGVVRAWMRNLRRASRILLAGHRENFRQDVRELIGGVDWLDLDADVRNIRDAVEQFVLADLTEPLIRAIGFLQEFADLDSHIPRIQQGQQPVSDSTAYELRQRLAASGKYLNEIVRRHDAGIVWMVGWVLYVMALTGEIGSEAYYAVLPKGFSNFQELVARLEGLLRLLGLGGQSEQINAWLRHEYLIRQVALADELDPQQALLSSEEHAERAQAAAQSEERALALAGERAQVAKLEAEAARASADAESRRDRGTLDRARFVRDVERDGMGTETGGGSV